ncbi:MULTISPECIES: hypothetical protein [Metallosphaera]|uniref:Uncharacterized protein n=2 Tax=Metallosphaera sedula TaxID=43687 RepID=A4YEI8_METS5|nr:MULTISPECIES: hypothetical protein [Metallosphaera]ABP94840.1 hypothetical protein Msed_0665 [Metallosphaera sedula DSM 5348]AIM26827.1 hypothetical protein HA72_0665 [Metallosphaera sedula]AKV73774.1 hypothetical protein MsedA_0678 [Metallosphaera sedula]AKV76014.1 hypothetical protein MsedB_0678 [Metallosphaera sedula]AKV78265.1 hypothetical protein MsedC_0677 [Metallosphaera sedula]
MSIDVDSGPFLSLNSVEGAGEAAAHVIAAASVLKNLNELTEESLEVVRKYVDNWILSVIPLDYIPGMAEYLGGKLTKSILDVFEDVSEEELGETLEMITLAKKSLDSGDVPFNFAEVEVRIERVFRALGLEMNDFGRFLENSNIVEKMKRTVTLFTLAIGISSVRDRIWIVESQ